MQHFEFSWNAEDGVNLFAQGWQPSSGPIGVVCLVHGLGDHSGRYAHVAEALTQAGFALLSFDLRGHGRSGGPRGHSPSFDAMMEDIGNFLEGAGKRYPDKACFLYGHSLGGNLVINYVLRRRPALAGVVATSPGLKAAAKLPSWKLSLGKITYSLWPTLQMSNGLDLSGLSRDPSVVAAYKQDPLVHDRVSARFGLDFLQAGEWALAHAAEFPLPLLVVQGSQDRLVSAEASRQFAQKAPECTFKLWEGFYHETHNEPEKSEVLAFTIDWMKERIPEQ